LISQLQVEKAAEKTTQAIQVGQAKQEIQPSQDESLTEAISGEVLNSEDIDSIDARAIDMEVPLEDIEDTFAPKVSGPESTSINLAEEILSQRMAAENVMAVEDDNENLSDFKLTSSDTHTEALPTPIATEPLAAEPVAAEPAVVDSEVQTETGMGQLKNFMIILAIITMAIIGFMLGFYLYRQFFG